MAYEDRAGSPRPRCWANPDAYDIEDDECRECSHKHTCRAEIERGDDDRPKNRIGAGMTVPVQRLRTGHREVGYSRRREREMDGRADWEPADIGSNETGFERFFKDSAAGAIRGFFQEAHEFWKRFRFR